MPAPLTPVIAPSPPPPPRRLLFNALFNTLNEETSLRGPARFETQTFKRSGVAPTFDLSRARSRPRSASCRLRQPPPACESPPSLPRYYYISAPTLLPAAPHPRPPRGRRTPCVAALRKTLLAPQCPPTKVHRLKRFPGPENLAATSTRLPDPLSTSSTPHTYGPPRCWPRSSAAHLSAFSPFC